MPSNEFKEIFISLFNGNVNQAESITEAYSDEYEYDNTDTIAEKWEKSQLQRKKYICNLAKKYGNYNN